LLSKEEQSKRRRRNVEGKTIKKLVMKISELPEEIRELAILRIKEEEYCDLEEDSLSLAFTWDFSKEGAVYWKEWHERKTEETVKEEPKHYDNSKGSLYKFCDEHELNSYEFDKTKFAIDLYIKEQLEKNK
jgi:hypothetical protein